jgi:hypothetical protein
MAKANEIQEEIKETRQHIEDAGSAMVEKLELLEERLREGVEGVKRNFDLYYQAEQHPLALFGGSLVIGYLLGNFFVGCRAPDDEAPRRGESFHRALPDRGNGVRDLLKKDIATTVKGMAAGALTSTLLNAGRRALLGRQQSEDMETGKQAVDLGKGLASQSGKRRRGYENTK